MKKQKIIVQYRAPSPIKPNSQTYEVIKTFNMVEPIPGELLSQSEYENYVRSSKIEVETVGK